MERTIDTQIFHCSDALTLETKLLLWIYSTDCDFDYIELHCTPLAFNCTSSDYGLSFERTSAPLRLLMEPTSKENSGTDNWIHEGELQTYFLEYKHSQGTVRTYF